MTTMTTMTAIHEHLTDLTDLMHMAHAVACNRSVSPAARELAREAWLLYQEAANDAEMALPVPLREEPDGY